MASIESAIISRWGSIKRIPILPFAQPSQGAIVQNSNGIPPASIMPYLTASARFLKCLCPGFISFQVLTTPIKGFSCISFSSSPNPFIIPSATYLNGVSFLNGI